MKSEKVERKNSTQDAWDIVIKFERIHKHLPVCHRNALHELVRTALIEEYNRCNSCN